MDVSILKDAIRRQVLARRSLIPPGERESRALLITESVLALPELETAGTILGFASMRSEVPTGALLRSILGSGRSLLLPYVADDGSLRATPVTTIDDLEPGFRGIHEPRTRFPVDPAVAGAAIVPGVAFDARGGRLGYGGGFFDGFLRASPGVVRVGICFEVQVVDEVPMEPHDEPVDVVVTEGRVLRTGAR